MTALVLVGLEGGEPFDAPGPLAEDGQLVFLVDASSDVPGAFARRQKDVRTALDRNGKIIFLLGPKVAEGLATQFGCWIRAKIGLDIVPWTEARDIEPAIVADGHGNAAIRFFSGDLPIRSDTARLRAVSRVGRCSLSIGLRRRHSRAGTERAPRNNRGRATRTPRLSARLPP
jgi:hypothetical protein